MAVTHEENGRSGRTAGRRAYSPSELCRFVASRFAAWMDRYARERPGEFEPVPLDEEAALVRRKGREHEAASIGALEATGERVLDLRGEPDRFAATHAAMRKGEPLIFQGALAVPPFVGYPDLLVRADGPSDLGPHHYVPREIKLGVGAKPAYLLQLCAYADMLEVVQGRRPARLELLLGDGRLLACPTRDSFHYYRRQRRAFLEFQATFDPERPPVPDVGADHGEWADEAARRLEALDHLSRVANIRATQIGRLEAAGIRTMTALAESRIERVPRLDPATFDRLRRQARLQLASVGRSRPRYEVLPDEPAGPPRGLALLPPASVHDVYFDMEGYPFAAGGLEYLFGATFRDGERLVFRDWWAHDRAEERAALEGFLDWVWERFRIDPLLHVYHYAAYEVTALKRLVGSHSTREARLDRLLRSEVFVDLYKVVRQGLLVGEPKYSIKNLERLFRAARDGEVTSAGDSIVEYQRWLDSDQPRDWRRSPILRGVRDYNREDCESTAQLTDWLRACQREHGIRFRGKAAADEADAPEDDPDDAAHRRRALAGALAREGADDVDRLLAQLVEFHRREDKPKWWEIYRRRELTDDELVEDLACLGRLHRVDGSERSVRRSRAIRYRFDADQDTKLDAGDTFHASHDLELRGRLEALDRERGEAELLFGPRVVESASWPPPARLSLIPHDVIPSEPLAAAIERVACDRLAGRPLPEALAGFLRREPPRLVGGKGGPLVQDGESPGDGCVRIVADMRDTTLSIQGPPGTGKTHTAARMILDLLARGRRVGITSNGHKAILNLLAKCAELHGSPLSCLKVGGDADDPLLARANGIEHVAGGRAAAALSRRFPLVGGTAWHFCRADMQRSCDYLFVDEAGQVAVANLVAMAGAAANLVLVGDQMQLGQPTQGHHPGESGASTLEYLLRGAPTIPSDRGVLLDVSYRLHPEICAVNSDAFYEGRLRAAPGCDHRVVRLPADRPSRVGHGAGIAFVPVTHEGNTQGSDEEVEVVRQIVTELQRLEYTDTRGIVAGRIGLDDVLVVAPYNMQVRRLRAALPSGARIGSVDKFQGQEALVVIVSMCSSDAHDSPRGVEFLLNPNRLNVALSRAQALAVVVGSPRIADSRCRTPEQICLVNLYCRIVGE